MGLRTLPRASRHWHGRPVAGPVPKALRLGVQSLHQRLQSVRQERSWAGEQPRAVKGRKAARPPGRGTPERLLGPCQRPSRLCQRLRQRKAAQSEEDHVGGRLLQLGGRELHRLRLAPQEVLPARHADELRHPGARRKPGVRPLHAYDALPGPPRGDARRHRHAPPHVLHQRAPLGAGPHRVRHRLHVGEHLRQAVGSQVHYAAAEAEAARQCLLPLRHGLRGARQPARHILHLRQQHLRPQPAQLL
mmetsp:Transcript_47682/g.121665  ORF Transcript_47682/g.121665 Transcript_47682/m.121665 type:complete len:247 (-) Transcript_47682:464-1204(-)